MNCASLRVSVNSGHCKSVNCCTCISELEKVWLVMGLGGKGQSLKQIFDIDEHQAACVTL